MNTSFYCVLCKSNWEGEFTDFQAYRTKFEDYSLIVFTYPSYQEYFAEAQKQYLWVCQKHRQAYEQKTNAFVIALGQHLQTAFIPFGELRTIQE